MVKSRSQITAVITYYVEALRRLGVETERVYLYGSYLRGTANEWSDIDVVVVSTDFAGKKPWQRAEITGIARHETFRATGESVEALPKTPEEVENRHPASFLADILKDAVLVYEHAPASSKTPS